MTFLSERQFDGSEGALVGAGGSTGWADVFWASRRQALEVDNALARSNMLEDAYDARIEAIAKATGQRLTNPYRGGVTPDDIAAAQTNPEGWRSTLSSGAWIEQAERRFERDLLSMAERYPDHRDVIRADQTPRMEARERARNAEKGLGEAINLYDGSSVGALSAVLAGGLAGMAQDPVNAATMLLGPWHGAGSSLKGLLWMAVRQGAWNAGTEAALQPTVAAWRKEAGLGYDAGDFARNVGTAFAFGAGADLGVRGGYRAVQAMRGRVPRLAPDGSVAGYWTPDEALEAAALKTRSTALAAARDGDDAALRTLARETGVDRNPDVRALIDAIDNRAANDPAEPGTDLHERDVAIAQVERHLVDRDEPLPVPPEPLPEARGASLADGDAPDVPYGAAVDVDERLVWREPSDGFSPGHAVVFERADGVREPMGDDLKADAWVLREADGWTRADAETVAARKRLAEGDVEPIEAALLMREHPQALDRSVAMRSENLRQARSLARLDDAAFDMVLAGDADPRLAALVGDLVPNTAEHAGILQRLASYAPATEADARLAIGALMRLGRRHARFDLGLDDVTGAEGDVQIAELQRLLSDEVAAAEGRAPKPADGEEPTQAELFAEKVTRGAFDDAPEASLATSLGEAARLEDLAQLIGSCKL
jgi:hypothetical protein